MNRLFILTALIAIILTLMTSCGPSNRGDDPMILVFNTNYGEGTTVTLPLMGEVDAHIDWGDGHTGHINEPGQATHTYEETGRFTVRISGSLSHFGTGETPYPNVGKLRRVQSFGNLGLESLSGAFNQASLLVSLPDSLPASVTDLSWLFAGAELFNLETGHWDVSNVTNMVGMFSGAASFNQPLNNWDTGRVTDMQEMFAGAESFNHPLHHWNVSSVTNMAGMFRNAVSFDQPLGQWDISQVTNMEDMFRGGSLSPENYNDLLTGWTTLPVRVNVTFHAGESIHSSWAAYAARRNLTDRNRWIIFDGNDYNIGVFSQNGQVEGQGSYPAGDTITLRAVPDPGYRFSHWEGWGTEASEGSLHTIVVDGNLTLRAHFAPEDPDAMAIYFDTTLGEGTTITLPLSGEVDVEVSWGDGQRETITRPGPATHTYGEEGRYMVMISGTLEQFGNGARGYENAEKILKVEQFGDLGLRSLSGAFFNAVHFNGMPFKFPSTVTDVSYMFYGATSFSEPLGDLDMQHVTNMRSMYQGAGIFFNDVYQWNVSNVTNMTDMFKDSGLPGTLYDRLLNRWAELPLQQDVQFHAGNSRFTPGEAATSRQKIIDRYNWQITDDGRQGDAPDPMPELSELDYEQIELWFRMEEIFSDYIFVGGIYPGLIANNYGIRLFVLNREHEFLYVSHGYFDSGSVQADVFRYTNHGYVPVHKLDPDIHTPDHSAPLIIVTTVADEGGDHGGPVYFLENDQVQEIGYLNIARHEDDRSMRGNNTAIGDYLVIEKEDGFFNFRFDTERVVFRPNQRRERILDASTCYYRYDGNRLEFVVDK